MPILYPSADVSVADWETGGGSGSNLYAEIDEGGGTSSTLAIGAFSGTSGVQWGGSTSGFRKLAQNFIADGTTITKFRVKLEKVLSPTDGVQVKIFSADGSHKPDTQVGVTSNVVDNTAITGTATVHEFTFATPVPVTDTSEYCVVVERSGAGDDTNNYVCTADSADPYASGQIHFWNGTAWTSSFTTTDLTCEIDFLSPTGSSDYIVSECAPGNSAKFELTNPSAGIVAATMRVSFRKDGADEANLTVRLLQNDGGSETVVAEWEYTDIADTDVDEEVALTSPQFALITDPSDLRVEFEAAVVSAEGYQGPGDVASGWIAYYGLRAFSNAAIGQTVVLLQRDNDNDTLAITTGADGDLDLVTAGYTAWAGANAITVNTLYDQIGGSANDLTSATGQQPQFFPTGGLGGLPTMRFVNASSHRFTCTGIAQTQPYSMVTVAKHNDASAGQSLFADNTASVAFYYYDTADDQVVLWAGGGVVQPVACTDDAWHSVQSIFSSTSSTITVDGSTSSSGVAIGTAALSTGTWGLGTYPAVGQFFGGDCAEFGILAGALSGGDLAAIYANQDAYYVIP